MYEIKDINDYQNRLTEDQKIALIKHCRDYDICPEICAWYDDMNDFYQDWIYDSKIYDNKEDAMQRFKDGLEDGEFKKFNSGEIVRLVL